MVERILIWGTGRIYEKWYRVVQDLVDEGKIDCLALISRELRQKKLNGYRVIDKGEIENYEFDKIVVMAEGTAKNSILEDIKNLQIDDNKFISVTHFLQKYCGNKYFTNNLPCMEFLELVKLKKEKDENITVAEIGVDIGATAAEVCKLLGVNDTYYCFDFEDTTSELIKYLTEIEAVDCHLIEKGNSHKTFDSYCWSLSKLLLKKHFKPPSEMGRTE